MRDLVLAVGEERFGKSLFMALRGTVAPEHCFVCRFRYGAPPACVINCGQLGGETSANLVQRYVRGLYTMDSNFPQVLSVQSGDRPLVLHSSDTMSAVFRERFIEPFAVSDMVGLAFATGEARYYAIMIRTQGWRFTDAQLQALASNADVIGAAIARHHMSRYSPDRAPAINLRSLFDASAAFSDVTSREKDVCRGILSGSCSSQIASDLGISVNSVLTYRKRLYTRLGISSQHELFEHILRATMCKRSRAV